MLPQYSARSTYQHVRRTSFIEADVDLDVRLSNSSPPCQVYSGVESTHGRSKPITEALGIEVSTWLSSCSLEASCYSLAQTLGLSFSFSFGLEEKIPDSKFVRWFSLATAVGLLCDEYWTGCVDGRHIISSHDEQRPRTNWLTQVQREFYWPKVSVRTKCKGGEER